MRFDLYQIVSVLSVLQRAVISTTVALRAGLQLGQAGPALVVFQRAIISVRCREMNQFRYRERGHFCLHFFTQPENQLCFNADLLYSTVAICS